MKSSIEIARISLISSPRGPACCNCFISWNQTARIGPTSVATHGNLNRFYYTNIHKVILYDIVYLVGGIPTSLKKMSQLGWLLNIPNRWKNKKVFQTMYIYILIIHIIHIHTCGSFHHVFLTSNNVLRWMPPNFASTPIHQTRSGVWGEERTDTIWQFIEQFSMESTPLISKIYQLTMLIFQFANFFITRGYISNSMWWWVFIIWWLFDGSWLAGPCLIPKTWRVIWRQDAETRLFDAGILILVPLLCHICFFGGKQLNHVESPQNHIQSYSYLLILNHIIFILYSSYIHIVFILYSYNIQIIFILYSYYIHIIFILYSYYIQIIFIL